MLQYVNIEKLIENCKVCKKVRLEKSKKAYCLKYQIIVEVESMEKHSYHCRDLVYLHDIANNFSKIQICHTEYNFGPHM